MTAFRDLAELDVLPIWDGVLARVVEGRQMTFAIVELEAGAAVGRHQHPQEQVGIVLKGRLRFTVGDETRELGEGATYVIPGDLPHEAMAGPEGAVVVDAFSPVRSDWSRFTPRPSAPGTTPIPWRPRPRE